MALGLCKFSYISCNESTGLFFLSRGVPPVFPECAVLTARLASISVSLWLTAAPWTSWLLAQATDILSSWPQTHTITPINYSEVFEVQFVVVELLRR